MLTYISMVNIQAEPTLAHFDMAESHLRALKSCQASGPTLRGFLAQRLSTAITSARSTFDPVTPPTLASASIAMLDDAPTSVPTGLTLPAATTDMGIDFDTLMDELQTTAADYSWLPMFSSWLDTTTSGSAQNNQNRSL
jgi:hypothetical protein